MKHFRKIWTEETDRWMLDNLEKSKTDMYGKFLKDFPKITDVTFAAFKNRCCRVGAVTHRNLSTSDRRIRPIGSEHMKKGYVRIKVAQPNVWKMKEQFVWEQNHPGETVDSKKELVIFLDGNRMNFNPENLMKVERRIAVILNNEGIFGCPCPKGDPVAMKMRVEYARHYLMQYELYRKLGMVSASGVERSKVNAWARARRARMTPEERQICKEKQREYCRNRVLTEEQKQHRREYARNWARRKREKELKNGK